MKTLRDAEPVKIILAVTYNQEGLLNHSLNAFEAKFSKIDNRSQCFNFDHTEYYTEEMGTHLMKQFFSFAHLFNKDDLVKWKLYSIELENKYSKENKRNVNIDPAYLELAKLVVSSSKNFDHRIYLGQGVYGDVQLRFRKGQFVTNEWTYPDYKSPIAINFLNKVRNIYFQQLKQIR